MIKLRFSEDGLCLVIVNERWQINYGLAIVIIAALLIIRSVVTEGISILNLGGNTLFNVPRSGISHFLGRFFLRIWEAIL